MAAANLLPVKEYFSLTSSHFLVPCTKSSSILFDCFIMVCMYIVILMILVVMRFGVYELLRLLFPKLPHQDFE
ncbi:hypothetical protein DDB_G0268736 [Dictyostelium discoideum AX4]|uniref:Uncharacterized protein n=1 Tax=Dictyostelium discoideum TaxID=44689 RepID=Q55EV3_DICDI|nr:hypothetical protein DDB_G0268736 [Dictyostelium discoideum AX4]EAL72957.1 hypothetical protein DDB_G0268736 [Dictyostelium discoideum AX4]|eukprot:XP_646917.1 hypothetical protein DDB_G0268736 [Dictyostelium discoideum AX4]